MQCPEIISLPSLVSLLEKLAPPQAAAPWDNSGLQVIGERQEIKRLAVALDPTPQIINQALAFDADFILSHHPLLFAPAYLNEDTPYTRIVRRLMRAGVHLYSAHTSLDGEPQGPVRWLAKALRLKDLTTLEPLAPESPYGFGFFGNLPARLGFDAFIKELREVLAANRVNVCGERPAEVLKVACCPGSGSSMWPQAKKLGADVLITGDVKYHTALDTELCLLDVGHFALEEEMMRQFAAELQQELAGVEVRFFAAADPIEPYII